MRKILPIFVIGVLILSGLGAGIAVLAQKHEYQIMEKQFFSTPVISDKNEYLAVDIKEANNFLMSEGEPILPSYVKTFTFPFGTKIKNVVCFPSGIHQKKLTKKIVPGPKLIPLASVKTKKVVSKTIEKQNVYTTESFFPDDWISYQIGCSLEDGKHVVLVSVQTYPARYAPGKDLIKYADNIEIIIAFDKPQTEVAFPDEYELVIIAPSEFSSLLQPLVNHKNSFGVETLLKTTEEIYDEYSGRDKPEQIKYFIKDAIESWDTKYVLLVGGLNSWIYAKPRDNENHGTSDWHLPVRYSNLDVGEPGYLCDLYYADIYKYENGEPVFDDWDSNGNGIFAEWSGFKKDKLDLYPDVYLGRLACRNTGEVEAVVNKIINYEQSPCDPSWFKKIVGITGDGFLDQEDLDIQWDTNGLPSGDYTIYGQSNNDEGEFGPIEEIHVKVDHTKDTKITFNHDDYLRIDNYPNYPAPPMAEIVSVSDGDVLGNSDYSYRPTEKEAYCNDHTGWADVEYRNGILHIRGKSYDPKPYGNITDIKVWIKNSDGNVIFTGYRNNTKMFSEGDWTVGEKMLHGRAGAFYYMPKDFEKVNMFSSSGAFNGMDDVIEEFSKGCGLVFFSGHGSPGWWGNHFPGIPGNRKLGEVEGLAVVNVDFYFPWIKSPLLPMNELSNTNKLPVVVVGGCHNSMFNISLIPSILDRDNSMYMHIYGRPTPECWSWYLVKLPEAGAIATIGNTGYGYGILGEWCTSGGVDNWITTEFFRQYGTEGQGILGEAHSQAVSSYITHFGKKDDGHVKTVQQWVLLGDPSLKIGGYS